jgi:bifunctional pyridoxal-dependent enzyme with beta-cystathionase and maltose regulon repressor activities
VFPIRFPKLTINIPEAGYSVLIDFAHYQLKSEKIDKVLREHNIAMNSMNKCFCPFSESSIFKIVVGCNREYLKRFLVRLEKAVAEIELIHHESRIQHE